MKDDTIEQQGKKEREVLSWEFIREEKSQDSIIEVFSANEMKGIALGGRAQNSALDSQLNLLRELTNEADIGRSLD